MRPCLAVCLILAVPCAQVSARAEDLPIIVGYELNKQRQETRSLVRNPRAFWIRQIVARIEDKKKDLATPLKAQATVQVTFVVARDGHVVSRAVIKSSGSEVADKTAITIIEGAQPFPPMPAAMADTQLAFTLPVRFR